MKKPAKNHTPVGKRSYRPAIYYLRIILGLFSIFLGLRLYMAYNESLSIAQQTYFAVGATVMALAAQPFVLLTARSMILEKRDGNTSLWKIPENWQLGQGGRILLLSVITSTLLVVIITHNSNATFAQIVLYILCVSLVGPFVWWLRR